MTVIEYKGMWYDKSEEIVYPTKLNATMAINKFWKLALRHATTTLNFHHGSTVYSPEAVLATYDFDPPVREARPDNNGWYRNETPFPLNAATRDFFLECAEAVDRKLKGL